MTVQIIGSWIWCFDCYQYKDLQKIVDLHGVVKGVHECGTVNLAEDTISKKHHLAK